MPIKHGALLQIGMSALSVQTHRYTKDKIEWIQQYHPAFLYRYMGEKVREEDDLSVSSSEEDDTAVTI